MVVENLKLRNFFANTLVIRMNNYPHNYSGSGGSKDTNDHGSGSGRIPMQQAIPSGVPVVPFGIPFPPFYPSSVVPMAPLAAPVNQPLNPDTTGYFGNLSPGVSDDVFTAVLGCCGGFKRLKRPVDPSNGKLKPFAFVEFEGRSDLIRSVELLQNFPLDNRHLNIKVEGVTGVSQSAVSVEEQLKCYEGISRILVGKRVTSGGSMEWLEKKILTLKETTKDRESVKRDSRQNQRNYSDLIETTISNEPQFTKTVSSNPMAGAVALKDRERRWESRVKEFERDLRKDLEKDEERARRHEKEAAELSEYVNKYSDEDTKLNNNLFFSDREKWRKMRQKAFEKEAEIFEEVLRIRREISVQADREFIEKVLPMEGEELFVYPVRWEKFVGSVLEEFKEICCERTVAFFSSSSSAAGLSARLGEIVFNQIVEKRTPVDSKILAMEPTFLAVSNDSSEAEILMIIIWRWLIYITSKE